MNPSILIAKISRYITRRFPIRHSFVRNTARKWFVDKELYTATGEGFFMYASPYDYMSHGIFFYGIYDPSMTEFFRTHVFEGAVCFDIGTERGWFTLLMARLVGNTGRVEAFEPYPPNYTKLQRNIELNQFNWINSYQVALSHANGHQSFVAPTDVSLQEDYLDGCSGVGFLVLGDNPDEQSFITVPTITLDSHLEASSHITRLDFIKIDVEGAEIAVLQGAKNAIQKYRPTIVIEYNRLALERAGQSIKELDDLLDNYNYERFIYTGTLKQYKPDEFNYLPLDEQVYNIYAFPRRH